MDTHAGLALAAFPERGVEFAAGEVFDDAVRMAGGMPNKLAPPSLFKSGIASNNAITDAAFDSQPDMRASLVAIEADLQAADIPRQMHRTCTGPGTDILFSGVTVQYPFAAEAYLEVCQFFESTSGKRLITDNTATSKREQTSVEEIERNINLIARHGLRVDYADPAFVVERLRARVDSRQRLRFPDDKGVDKALTEVFATQQVRLAKAADAIYSGTLMDLTQDLYAPLKFQTDAPLMPLVPHVISLVENASTPLTTEVLDDWPAILNREMGQRPPNTEKQRRLFVASRGAAHFLVQKVARVEDEVTITPRNNEAPPTFPDPWTGSISHSGDWVAVSMTNTDYYAGIGADLECKFGSSRRDRVLTPDEQTLPALDELSPRTLYSIKEAVFKAIHPLVQDRHPDRFWYQDAEITALEQSTNRVDIRLAATERGRLVAAALGDRTIQGYFLQKPAYSSAVCVVSR